MTRKQIEKNALEYDRNALVRQFHVADAYIAGAESRNEEIDQKDAEIAELKALLEEFYNGIRTIRYKTFELFKKYEK